MIKSTLYNAHEMQFGKHNVTTAAVIEPSLYFLGKAMFAHHNDKLPFAAVLFECINDKVCCLDTALKVCFEINEPAE